MPRIRFVTLQAISSAIRVLLRRQEAGMFRSAMYSDSAGVYWSAGANALATKLR